MRNREWRVLVFDEKDIKPGENHKNTAVLISQVISHSRVGTKFYTSL
jgi:hypothetical protein